MRDRIDPSMREQGRYPSPENQAIQDFYARFDPHPMDMPLKPGTRSSHYEGKVRVEHHAESGVWHVRWDLEGATDASGKDARKLSVRFEGTLSLGTLLRDLNEREQRSILDGDPDTNREERWNVRGSASAEWTQEAGVVPSLEITMYTTISPVDTQDGTDTFKLTTPRIMTPAFLMQILSAAAAPYGVR